MSRSYVVMVIDDDADIRNVVGLILRQAGYEAVTAEHGREALDLIARNGPPDLILLDMNMPVMNGWAFAEEACKGSCSDVPILVITAALDAQRSADQIGAAGHIGKPFELADLLGTVQQHLAQLTKRS